MRIGANIVVLGIVLVLGARVWSAVQPQTTPLLDVADRSSVLTGVVADDPDRRDSSVRVTVDVATQNGLVASGKIIASLPVDTEVEYGDTVTVRGILEEPKSFETNTGRTFDYPGYLKARGVVAILPNAALRATEPGGWSVLRTLFEIKHTFERALERVMQEPMASLMEGFLLGEKSGLPKELTQAFIIVGLIHVIVLSGYNIGVVSEWALRLFASVLPRRAALIATGIVIVFFAIMAGGGMATIRACLMGLIALLARYMHRPAAAMRALVFAVVAMVLYNPLVLFDVGFVLSVLATFGLITLSPWVESKLTRLPAGGIRSTAATTIAVQLFVLPALLYFTGVLSFVAVPVNVLVLPFVPLAMLLGFVAGVLALLHPLVAFVPALLADLLLRVMIFIAEAGASLPFAAAIVAPFPAWVAWLVYVPLTALAIWLFRKSETRLPPN